MSRISRCGETRGIPHGKTPASSPSRARDDERGGRRARPSPKRGARARAGSSPVHRRFIAGSWLVHGWFMAGSRGHGATPAGAAGCPKTARAPIAARMMRADGRPPPNEYAERTHRSNSPVEHTDQIRRSHLSVEHTDRTCRSNSPLKFVDHTCRSNTPTKLAARRDRATASRLAAPASPPDSGRPAAASRSARRRSRTPHRA